MKAAFSGNGINNVSGIDNKSEGLLSISNYDPGVSEYRAAVLERG